MQIPQWAEPLDDGVGIRRAQSLKLLMLFAAVLMFVVGIAMPIATLGNPKTEPVPIIVIGVVFVLMGIGLVYGAFTLMKKPVLKIDDVGIHRIGNGPYVLLPWSEISAIDRGAQGTLVITTPRGRIKKDGSRTKTKTFYLKPRALQGGQRLTELVLQQWQSAGGYRP